MKKKLKLTSVEVQSFITSEKLDQVKGGQETIICLTGNYPTLPAKECVSNALDTFCFNVQPTIVCVPTEGPFAICQKDTIICLTGTETSPSMCKTLSC